MVKQKSEMTPDEAASLMLYADVEFHSESEPQKRYISRRWQGSGYFYGFGETPLDAAIDSQRKIDNGEDPEGY